MEIIGVLKAGLMGHRAFAGIMTALVFWKNAQVREICLILALMGFVRGAMAYLGFSSSTALVSSGIIACIAYSCVHAGIRKFGG